jgi:hypothetical protein
MKAEFVCACWIRQKNSSLAGVTPPSVASIEAESNVTTCRDEDDTKKVQAESA